MGLDDVATAGFVPNLIQLGLCRIRSGLEDVVAAGFVSNSFSLCRRQHGGGLAC